MRFSTFGKKKPLKNNIDDLLARENSEMRTPRKKDVLGRKLSRIFFYFVFLSFFVLILMSLKVFGNDNYYMIRRNETLDDIARKFNISRQLILNLNDFPSNVQLQEGMKIQIPFSYDNYTVKPGDTLSDIADENGIKVVDLLEYINRSTPGKYTVFSRLKSGEKIRIPRMLSHIKIKSSKIMGLNPFRVEFYVITNTRDKVKKYKWDFGDGSFSDKKAPVHTYERNGVYSVRLEVVDENNRDLISNALTITVRNLDRIAFTERKFFELNPGDIIDLNARVVVQEGEDLPFDFPVTITGTPSLLEQVGNTDTFRIARSSGAVYTNLEIECLGSSHQGWYFLSPVPSRHVSRFDQDWYRSQFGTGLLYNSGPASAAMAIAWASGTDVAVRTIRSYLGIPNHPGAVGFNHLIKALNRYRISAEYLDISGEDEIKGILDRGHLAIVHFNPEKISPAVASPEEDLFGRYYTETEEGDHFAIIKGYSLDGRYFIVYDPMPADWDSNEPRYSDNLSQWGKNRYYQVTEVMNALITRNALEVIN